MNEPTTGSPDLDAALRGLGRDFIAARKLADDIAARLRSGDVDPRIALAALKQHDRVGNALAAGVLASAIGKVDSPAMIDALAHAAFDLRNQEARQHAVRSLAQRRRASPVGERPSWGLHSLLVDVEAPIAEDDARTYVLQQTERLLNLDLAKAKDPTQVRFLVSVLETIGHSLNDGRAVALLEESTTASHHPLVRDAGIRCLAAWEGDTISSVVEALLPEYRNGSMPKELVRGFVEAVMSRGSDGSIRSILAEQVGSDPQVRAQFVAGLAGVLQRRTDDGTAELACRALLEAVRSSVADADRSMAVASLQPFLASTRVSGTAKAEAIQLAEGVVRDVGETQAMRQAALSALTPTGPDSQSSRDRLVSICKDTTISVDLRVQAIRQLAESSIVVADARASALALLDELAQRAEPRAVQTAVSTARGRLQKRSQ